MKALLPIVQQLNAEGRARKEIAKELGLQSGKRSALLCTAQAGKVIPKQGERTPAKILAEYKYGNKIGEAPLVRRLPN